MEEYKMDFNNIKERISMILNMYDDVDVEWFLSELGMLIDSYCYKHGYNPVEAAKMLYETCKQVNDIFGDIGTIV